MTTYLPSIRQTICAAAASLAFLPASPGRAADFGVAPIYRAYAPVANWTGSYIGISGGGIWGSSVVHNDLTGADQTPHFGLSGGIVGVTTGLNIQNHNLVYGYESDTSYTGARSTAFDFPPNAAFTNEVKEPWLTTYRGRIGYAQNSWLLYATGGAALAGIHDTMAGPPGSISEQHWHWGWTVGGGVEMKLTREWSAKVEYLYVGLQDKSYFNPAPNPLFASGQRVSLDDHIVRVGINYKLPWSILDVFYRPSR
jgi:outer membrane immunogenic protein